MRELVIFCCLLFAGLNAQAFTIYGDSVAVGKGAARAFADVDKYGKLRSVGMAFNEGALQGLPPHDHEYTLRLPTVLNVPPYNHMVINWNPHGHEPQNIYGLPHFDFHFYFITEDMRKSITCAGPDQAVCLTQPAPEKLPPFYVPTPEGVPQMGWHWLDPRSPEFHGKVFTATYIYGFYNGNMTFVEPMITRDFLLRKVDLNKQVPLPAVFPAKGYYPQSYSIVFDADTKLYFISLKNQNWHN